MGRDIKKILKGLVSKRKGYEIDPDEILIDAKNLPEFNTDQFEGRIVKPISIKSILFVGVFFVIIYLSFTAKIVQLQIVNGANYKEVSENNRLNHTPIFAERGVFFDRKDNELAWNEKSPDPALWFRKYSDYRGLAHIIGYVKYPSKDKNGFYYREDYEGMDGLEKLWNEKIKGLNGLNIIETNALGKLVSENMIQPPKSGTSIKLAIDAELNQKLFDEIKALSEKVDFLGGAGVIMNVQTGEVIALTSAPEYDSQTLTDGKDSAKINEYLNSPSKPFLNKVIDGSYTPGSIVKPFIALAALSERIIDPDKKILSTGEIEVPNDYDPSVKNIFKDWKAHGYVDMRRALAVSSNVYFYEIGGGFKDQKGLGIEKIDKYLNLFGFGSPINAEFFEGSSGTIPSPEWKGKNFAGEGWRLGDTYHTSIGQYGFQVSPIQMLVFVSAIARNGSKIFPTILKNEDGDTDDIKTEEITGISADSYKIIQEGMRLAVTDKSGTAKILDVPYLVIAAKSGTAELGETKNRVNSWVMGFYPYEKPKYAFVVMMEKGPRANTVGAGVVMRYVLDWMHTNTPEYLN